MRRCFEGCGLHSMSLVAVKEGESPNSVICDDVGKTYDANALYKTT